MAAGFSVESDDLAALRDLTAIFGHSDTQRPVHVSSLEGRTGRAGFNSQRQTLGTPRDLVEVKGAETD